MASRFFFLAADHTELYSFCSSAENLAQTKPSASLGQSRLALEKLTKDVIGTRGDNHDRINRIAKFGEAPEHIVDIMHRVRVLGNCGVHIDNSTLESKATSSDAKAAVELLVELMIWYVLSYEEKQCPVDRFADIDIELAKSYGLVDVQQEMFNQYQAELDILQTEKAKFQKEAEVLKLKEKQRLEQEERDRFEAELKEAKKRREEEARAKQEAEEAAAKLQRDIIEGEKLYNFAKKQFARGTTSAFKKAFENATKAANLGNANAQTFLGLMYNIGKGTVIDIEKAVYWYRKAIEQGHYPAMYFLGQYYETVCEDVASAMEWYEKSARLGYNVAMYDLAKLMATHGKREEGKYWFYQAAQHGHPEALELIRRFDK